MTQVTMLSASQISHLLDLPSVIDAVADAYKEKANHPATLWPMVYEQLGGEADMDIRSGVLASKHVFGPGRRGPSLAASWLTRMPRPC